jgi:hypothetical protein
MRYGEQHRPLAPGLFDQQPHGSFSVLPVERRGWLVRQQDARPVKQGAGDGDSLALPAAELAWLFTQLADKAQLRRQFADSILQFAPIDPAVAAHDSEVIGHVEKRQQLRLLEYESNAGPAQLNQPPG